MFTYEQDARRSRQGWDERGLPTYDALRHLFFHEGMAVEYLIRHGVVDVLTVCPLPNCFGAMQWLTPWPMDRERMHRNCFVRRCTTCRKCRCIFSGTIVKRFHKPKNEFLHFTYLWLCGDSTKSIRSKLGWAKRTVSLWSLYLREICIEAVERRQETHKIGGPGIEVQIDEAKFGKRKYNRGHRVYGTWVFAGVEVVRDENGRRKTRDKFAVTVPDRSRDTLLPILLDHVAPQTEIASDGWGAYFGIPQMIDSEGFYMYMHGMVNHEKHFKDPVTGVNTNAIEGFWASARAEIPHRSFNDADTVQGYLHQHLWKSRHKRDLWQQFIVTLRCCRYEV